MQHAAHARSQARRQPFRTPASNSARHHGAMPGPGVTARTMAAMRKRRVTWRALTKDEAALDFRRNRHDARPSSPERLTCQRALNLYERRFRDPRRIRSNDHGTITRQKSQARTTRQAAPSVRNATAASRASACASNTCCTDAGTAVAPSAAASSSAMAAASG